MSLALSMDILDCDLSVSKPFSQWQHSFHMKAVLPLFKSLATASHHFNDTYRLHMPYLSHIKLWTKS